MVAKYDSNFDRYILALIIPSSSIDAVSNV